MTDIPASDIPEDEGTTERVTPLTKFIELVHQNASAEGGNFIIYEMDFLYIWQEVARLDQAVRELGEMQATIEHMKKYILQSHTCLTTIMLLKALVGICDDALLKALVGICDDALLEVSDETKKILEGLK